jgi:hypothetical protein
MNWGRGLFRFWLLFSALTIFVTMASSYERVREEFRVQSASKADWSAFLLLLPIDCRQARGKEGEDFKKEDDGPWRQYRKNPELRLCWFEEPKLRQLYPEYKDIPEKELSQRLYESAELPIKVGRPWGVIIELIGMVVGICGSVFAIGYGLLWALSGFKKAA